MLINWHYGFSQGGSKNQDKDDGGRIHNDWLSTSGRQSEFLPLCFFQPSHSEGGCGLSNRQNRLSGLWTLDYFQINHRINIYLFIAFFLYTSDSSYQYIQHCELNNLPLLFLIYLWTFFILAIIYYSSRWSVLYVISFTNPIAFDLWTSELNYKWDLKDIIVEPHWPKGIDDHLLIDIHESSMLL